MSKRQAISLSVLALAGVLLVGCSSGPQRIDATGDERVTSMGINYNDLVEWSGTLTQRMLRSAFLDQYKPFPVRLAVSDIENKTNESHLPKDMMMGRIRAALLDSGKVRIVSSYGKGMKDKQAVDSQELKHDPRFEKAEWNTGGTLKVARLSLVTQFLYKGDRQGSEKQNTYEVHMMVTDAKTGDVVWEGFSDPIAKKTDRASVGW